MTVSDLEAQASVIHADLSAVETLVDATTPAGAALTTLHAALYKGATMLDKYLGLPLGTLAGGGKPTAGL